MKRYVNATKVFHFFECVAADGAAQVAQNEMAGGLDVDDLGIELAVGVAIGMEAGAAIESGEIVGVEGDVCGEG